MPHGQVFPGLKDDSWDADTTNPSPHPLSNGFHTGYHGVSNSSSILLAYRGCPYNCNGTELLSLAYATHFQGPYKRINDLQPLFDNPAEDPFIWQDKRGNSHILMHSLEPEGGFGDGPKGGRHALSRTIAGPWIFGERTLAFDTTVVFDDGCSVELYRREKPQLFFSDDGEVRPEYLTTGVQPVGSGMSYSVIVPVGGC
jgi:hypothetical protein